MLAIAPSADSAEQLLSVYNRSFRRKAGPVATEQIRSLVTDTVAWHLDRVDAARRACADSERAADDRNLASN